MEENMEGNVQGKEDIHIGGKIIESRIEGVRKENFVEGEKAVYSKKVCKEVWKEYGRSMEGNLEGVWKEASKRDCSCNYGRKRGILERNMEASTRMKSKYGRHDKSMEQRN